MKTLPLELIGGGEVLAELVGDKDEDEGVVGEGVGRKGVVTGGPTPWLLVIVGSSSGSGGVARDPGEEGLHKELSDMEIQEEMGENC
ncbi:hypothetical protein ACFX2J_042393 [Malus domestica]